MIVFLMQNNINLFYEAIKRKGTKEKPVANEALVKECTIHMIEIFSASKENVKVKGFQVQNRFMKSK